MATAPFKMAVASFEVSGWIGASVAVRSKISLMDEFKVITSFEVLVLAWTEALAAMHASLTSELKMVGVLVGGWTRASVVMRSRISLTNESEVAAASFKVSGWVGASVAVRSKISLTDEPKGIAPFEMLVLAWTEAPAVMRVLLMSEFKVSGWTRASVAIRSKISLTDKFEVMASFGMLMLV